MYLYLVVIDLLILNPTSRRDSECSKKEVEYAVIILI